MCARATMYEKATRSEKLMKMISLTLSKINYITPASQLVNGKKCCMVSHANHRSTLRYQGSGNSPEANTCCCSRIRTLTRLARRVRRVGAKCGTHCRSSRSQTQRPTRSLPLSGRPRRGPRCVW